MPKPISLFPGLLCDEVLTPKATRLPLEAPTQRVHIADVCFDVYDPLDLSSPLLIQWGGVFDVDPGWNVEAQERGWTLVFSPLEIPSRGAQLGLGESTLSFQRGMGERRDLEVIFHPQTRIAYASIDSSLGAVEAAFQVVLQYALRQRGGLLVHASAGYAQGQGWLIPGPSGAGKSTAVREGGFDEVLSDEMVAITPSPKGRTYLLWGTPFWSEGRQFEMSARAHSLDLITLPIKGGGPALTPCSPAEGARALLKATTSYERSSAAHSDLFEIVCLIAEQTPCAHLEFPRLGPWRDRLP